MDPTRRQLLTLAQNAGVTLDPVIEVESPVVAVELAQRGVGDTIITKAVVDRLGPVRGLHAASLSPPLHETFAFSTGRHTTLSPATTVMIRLARQLIQGLPRPALA